MSNSKQIFTSKESSIGRKGKRWDFVILYYRKLSNQRNVSTDSTEAAEKALKFTEHLVERYERIGFKGYYDERDQIPGHDIFDDLFKALHHSQYVIIVLCRYFIDGPWQRFSLKQSVLSLLDERRNVIVVTCKYLGDPQGFEIPKELTGVESLKFSENFDCLSANKYQWNRLEAALRGQKEVSRDEKPSLQPVVQTETNEGRNSRTALGYREAIPGNIAIGPGIDQGTGHGHTGSHWQSNNGDTDELGRSTKKRVHVDRSTSYHISISAAASGTSDSLEDDGQSIQLNQAVGHNSPSNIVTEVRDDSDSLVEPNSYHTLNESADITKDTEVSTSQPPGNLAEAKGSSQHVQQMSDFGKEFTTGGRTQDLLDCGEGPVGGLPTLGTGKVDGEADQAETRTNEIVNGNKNNEADRECRMVDGAQQTPLDLEPRSGFEEPLLPSKEEPNTEVKQLKSIGPAVAPSSGMNRPSDEYGSGEDSGNSSLHSQLDDPNLFDASPTSLPCKPVENVLAQGSENHQEIRPLTTSEVGFFTQRSCPDGVEVPQESTGPESSTEVKALAGDSHNPADDYKPKRRPLSQSLSSPANLATAGEEKPLATESEEHSLFHTIYSFFVRKFIKKGETEV